MTTTTTNNNTDLQATLLREQWHDGAPAEVIVLERVGGKFKTELPTGLDDSIIPQNEFLSSMNECNASIQNSRLEDFLEISWLIVFGLTWFVMEQCRGGDLILPGEVVIGMVAYSVIGIPICIIWHWRKQLRLETVVKLQDEYYSSSERQIKRGSAFRLVRWKTETARRWTAGHKIILEVPRVRNPEDPQQNQNGLQCRCNQ